MIKDEKAVSEKFTLRISPDDRKRFKELARVLHRSQSDAIRFVVHQTLKAFENESTANKKAQKKRK